MATIPALPALPVSTIRSNTKTFQLRLRYCDFCQQSTFHSCQPEEREETVAGPSPSVIPESSLLQCSGCQAYTTG